LFINLSRYGYAIGRSRHSIGSSHIRVIAPRHHEPV